MKHPPRPFSENPSPIPPGPPGPWKILDHDGMLGYGGTTVDSEAIQRLSGESASVLQDLFGQVERIASELVHDPQRRASSAKLREIIQACDRGTTFARKLSSISLRERQQRIVLDLVDFIRGLEIGTMVPEEILYCEHFPRVPCRVMADPERIEEVLRALVSNATSALDDADPGTAGVVWVGLERISGSTLAGAQRLGWIHLQVADNGCGMDARTASRAFDPFFTTRGDRPGRGLGLAVAQGFVRQAGGTMTLESAPSWGTRANVWLPVASSSDGPNSVAE